MRKSPIFHSYNHTIYLRSVSTLYPFKQGVSKPYVRYTGFLKPVWFGLAKNEHSLQAIDTL